MRPDVLLATLNPKPAHYAVTASEHAAVAPNLHLGMLAGGLLAQGLVVWSLDSELEGLDLAGLADRATAIQPRLLLVVCSGANPSSSTMIMALAVDLFTGPWRPVPGTTTALWGPHPTVLPERFLRETGVDLVVRGEGFRSLPALVDALRAGWDPCEIPGLSWIAEDGSYGASPDAPLLEDLDAIPRLDWEGELAPERFRSHNWHAFGHLTERSPYAIVWTSLGCPFRCTFCSVNNLFPGPRRQRFRRIERAVEELVWLRRRGVRMVRLFDELFVASRARVEAFCDGLEEAGVTDLSMWCYTRLDTVDPNILRRLARVGLTWISYGFESPTARVLEGVSKGVRADAEEVIRATRDGQRRAILCAGHGAEQVAATLGRRCGEMALEYSVESTPLGTAGALRRALAWVDEPRLLVLNGDSLCGLDPRALLAGHLRATASATLAVVRVPDSARFGRVHLDRGRWVCSFEEKGAGGPGWINAGVYLLDRAVLDGIPVGRACSLEREVFPGLVGRGLRGHRAAGPFADIDTPDTWAGAAEALARILP